MRVRRSVVTFLLLPMLALVSACHRETVDVPPLPKRLISIADKFFDVQAIDADHAVVVGYGGKILLTQDGGFTWTQSPSGTDGALYSVRFVNPTTGWISGQDGIILHTTDGGKTWARQESGTNVYLFALDFTDENHGWAVGDKAIAIETDDGGKTWVLRKIDTGGAGKETADQALASEDPVLYDVRFVDENTGWISGEFGKLFHTTDGGKTWKGQEESLMGQGIIDVLDIPTFFGLSLTSAQEGVAVGLEGKIVRTSDGGTSWKFEPQELDYPMADPLYKPVLFPDGTGWAVGASGEVLRRDGAHAPWKRVKLGMEVVTWLRSMSWLDQNQGWIVGGYGLILHTKDGGKTWIPSFA